MNRLSELNCKTEINKDCAGIYGIVSDSHDRIYIGSSSSVIRRKKTHLRSLRNGKHHCQYLQNSWNKYGANSYRFILIEEVKFTSSDSDINKMKLFRFEQKYLDRYGAYLYNSQKIAGGYKQFKLSLELRKRELLDTYANEILRLHFSLLFREISETEVKLQEVVINEELHKNLYPLLETEYDIEQEKKEKTKEFIIDTTDISLVYLSLFCVILAIFTGSFLFCVSALLFECYLMWKLFNVERFSSQ